MPSFIRTGNLVGESLSANLVGGTCSTSLFHNTSQPAYLIVTSPLSFQSSVSSLALVLAPFHNKVCAWCWNSSSNDIVPSLSLCFSHPAGLSLKRNSSGGISQSKGSPSTLLRVPFLTCRATLFFWKWKSLLTFEQGQALEIVGYDQPYLKEGEWIRRILGYWNRRSQFAEEMREWFRESKKLTKHITLTGKVCSSQ